MNSIVLFLVLLAISPNCYTANKDEPIATTELFAIQDLQISSKVSGNLLRMNYKSGDFVEKGQVIAEIDSKQARARLDFAIEEQKVAQYQAQLAKISLEEEKLEFNRIKELWEKKSSSKQDLDKQGYRLQRAEVEVLRLESEAMQKAAKVRELESSLEDYSIKAPFSGVLLDDFRLSIGQLVQSGSELVRFADLSSMKARTYVAARYWNQLNKAMKLELKFDGLSKKYPGKLVWVSDYVHPQSRSKAVDILIENHKIDGSYALVPGNFGVIYSLSQ